MPAEALMRIIGAPGFRVRILGERDGSHVHAPELIVAESPTFSC
jgi:hypothetical protein